MSKKITFANPARIELSNGVNKLADAVTATLGPSGRNVIIEQDMGNPISTKDGVTVAKSIVLEDKIQNIEEYSKEITDEAQLKQIATISANNDTEVGELISTAMDKVGRDGVVTIEESKTGETYLETVEGMQFDRGYKSPYFVTDNNSMTAVLKEPFVLIVDKRLNQVKELLPILEAVSQQNKSLLIIADDIDGEALSTLVVNKMRGILACAAVKAPEFGDRKKAIMEDIAILTGGQVVSSEKGMRLDKFDTKWLGKANKATISKEFKRKKIEWMMLYMLQKLL